jgi:hypothetical protein
MPPKRGLAVAIEILRVRFTQLLEPLQRTLANRVGIANLLFKFGARPTRANASTKPL